MDPDFALAIASPWGDGPDDSVADTVAEWRRRNQARVRARARLLLEERQIGPDAAGPDSRDRSDAVLRLLDACANTSDPPLSDLFAALLANLFDPRRREGVHATFPTVLAQLSPEDAVVLLSLDRDKELRLEARVALWERNLRRDPNTLPFGPAPERRTTEAVAETVEKHGATSLPLPAVETSLWSLLRLGVCANDHPHDLHAFDSLARGWHLTIFAHRLLGACAGSEVYWYDRIESRIGRLIRVVT